MNGNSTIEKAAVYIQGNNRGLVIQGNDIVTNGDAGFLSEFGAAITNTLIDSNTSSGQTFEGSNPGGVGFGTQFNVGNNVPRQLVTMGNGGSGPYLSNTITFSNNGIAGITGGISSDDGTSEQGNNLVTIDADTVLFENNAFTGFTDRFATALRSLGTNSSLINNTFDNTTGGTRGGSLSTLKGLPESIAAIALLASRTMISLPEPLVQISSLVIPLMTPYSAVRGMTIITTKVVTISLAWVAGTTSLQQVMAIISFIGVVGSS